MHLSSALEANSPVPRATTFSPASEFAQPSLFQLDNLIHADTPIQAFSKPHPAISRLVLGPLPVGQGPSAYSRPRRLRVLAVSSSGSHFAAPTFMYDGCIKQLLNVILVHLAQDPSLEPPVLDVETARRPLHTVQELCEPNNWHLWLGSPSVATSTVWSWATLASQAASQAPPDAHENPDPTQVIAELGGDYLTRCINWALSALSPDVAAVLRRRLLPQPLALRLICRLRALECERPAKQYLRQALLSQPLAQLRCIAEPTSVADGLFNALCQGRSLSQAMGRAYPGITSGAQRHALRCASIIPDIGPSTWVQTLRCLPHIGRHRWPDSQRQWKLLLDLVNAAETASAQDVTLVEPKALIEAVSTATQYLHQPGHPTEAARLGRHWSAAVDGPAVGDANDLARQILRFRAALYCAMRQVGPMDRQCWPSAKSDDALVDRIVSAFAHRTDRKLVRELSGLLAKCPAVTIEPLTFEMVRSQEEAADIGMLLDNCLRGSGRAHYGSYLLNGTLLATISFADQIIGLVTVEIDGRREGTGIVARAGTPLGIGNTALSATTSRHAERFAVVLEEGTYGLETYVAVVTAFLRVCGLSFAQAFDDDETMANDEKFD
jgi:hypothetical protein